jgi:hypothetical protein
MYRESCSIKIYMSGVWYIIYNVSKFKHDVNLFPKFCGI